MATLGHEFQGVALHFIESRSNLAAIEHASLGEADAAPVASKQLHAQEIFERADLPAYRALGHGQFVCRLGKTLVARGRFECRQRRR